jgi:hypothetical protein
MVITYNGMLAAELGEVCWQKSWHSNPNGECVELAALPTGEIAMRNSRFPAGPILLYTQAEITAFLAGAKDGQFDHLTGGTTILLTSNSTTARQAATRGLKPGKLVPCGLRKRGGITTSFE